MRQIAFIGDVHGSISALDASLDALRSRSIASIVFLGDYVNKGPDSRLVLDRLISEAKSGEVVLLRGNHEAAFLHALDSGDLRFFLKMGGAATVRSYVGGDVEAEVLRAFAAAVPRAHIEALRAMPLQYKTLRLIAQHEPFSRIRKIRVGRYLISAHRPTGKLPRIGPRSAEIDTGCGAADGRLTSFIWPSRTYIQVDASGGLVTPAGNR